MPEAWCTKILACWLRAKVMMALIMSMPAGTIRNMGLGNSSMTGLGLFSEPDGFLLSLLAIATTSGGGTSDSEGITKIGEDKVDDRGDGGGGEREGAQKLFAMA